MTINGNSGNDIFEIGQLYYLYSIGIDPADLVATTRGDLSAGVSFPTVINGGTGEDFFEVFHNLAELQLNGEAGDDTFVLRTFILVDKATTVTSGIGQDVIRYVMNAPVLINGGDGYDKVIVIGTELGDTFVITDAGIWGAGRYVSYTAVELLVMEGMEGNDTFFVLSTNPLVETRIYGGLGSDTIFVGKNAPAVQADDLQGHSGLVSHEIESSISGLLTNVPVDGVGADIVDDDAPAVIV